MVIDPGAVRIWPALRTISKGREGTASPPPPLNWFADMFLEGDRMVTIWTRRGPGRRRLDLPKPLPVWWGGEPLFRSAEALYYSISHLVPVRACRRVPSERTSAQRDKLPCRQLDATRARHRSVFYFAYLSKMAS